MVELQNVSVTYSSGVDALNNVSLKINDGDFAFVVGSSGAGKSTMIKLLLKEIDAQAASLPLTAITLTSSKSVRYRNSAVHSVSYSRTSALFRL